MIRVLFFASLREAVGFPEIDLPLGTESGPGCDLDVLLAELKNRLTSSAYAALIAENVRIAVNRELVAGTVALRAGDEVAFLPPVTGG